MDPFTLSLIAGGASSLAGGFMGGQAQNKSGRQARDWYDKRTREAGKRQGYGFFGYSPYQDFLTSGWDTTSEPDAAAAAGRFNDSIGGGVLEQLQALAPFLAGGQKAILGEYDEATKRLAAGDENVARRVGGLYRNAGEGALGAFRGRSNEIGGLAAGAEDIARGYGRGAGSIIDEEGRRALGEANAATNAALASRGLSGGSIGANLEAANIRNVGFDKARKKVDVEREMTDRLLAARGGRIGTLSDLARSELGAGTSFGLAGAGAQAGALGQKRARLAGREASRTGLQTENLLRHTAMKQMPLDAIMGILGGGIQNPWLGQNTTGFYPGASGAGSALATGGNALALLGAFGLGSGGGGGSGGDPNTGLNNYLPFLALSSLGQ